MKIYNLPRQQFSLSLSHIPENEILNKVLYDKINSKKKEIDSVRFKWDSAKKISNDYEYIYTSSNTHRNVSSIIPVSRSFFKLREIIYDYHLDTSGIIGCIAEAPGGFIQSIVKHKDEYSIKTEKIHGITLVSDDKDVPYWNPNLVKHPIVNICNGRDGTGDLYKLENVLEFIHSCGKSQCRLVTADGGFDYTSNFEQELSSYKLFYSEIMIAINTQIKGGTFICKLFDLFYISSIQLVFLLYLSYEHVSFIKPYTSRQSNSEKYIVCRGFKGYQKDISNLLCSYFGKTILPIELPKEFITMIDDYHTKFISNQMNRIDGTLRIITKRLVLEKPSYQQIKLAKEWCQLYKIPINRSCIYLNRTR